MKKELRRMSLIDPQWLDPLQNSSSTRAQGKATHLSH
jgi:hypothetical protein